MRHRRHAIHIQLHAKNSGEIFSQLLHPRFGDGVDILIGADKKDVVEAAQKLGLDADQALKDAHYQVFDSPVAITSDLTRAAAIYNGADFIPEPVVSNVVKILSRNPNGFEWDMHTDNLEKGLKRALVMDAMIKRVATGAPADTLILFAADHSFDVRLRGGKRNVPVTKQRLVVEPSGTPLPSSVFRVDAGHTGEEILVAAQGPGSERIHGFIPNTDLFHVMLKAYGWTESP